MGPLLRSGGMSKSNPFAPAKEQSRQSRNRRHGSRKIGREAGAGRGGAAADAEAAAADAEAAAAKAAKSSK